MPRRLFQLHLRHVLVAMVFISLPLAWVTNAQHNQVTEEATINSLKTQYVRWQRPLPRWQNPSPYALMLCPTSTPDRVEVRTHFPGFSAEVGEALGLSMFQRIVEIDLSAPALKDRDLMSLARLAHLQRVTFPFGQFSQEVRDEFRARRPDVQLYERPSERSY